MLPYTAKIVLALSLVIAGRALAQEQRPQDQPAAPKVSKTSDQPAPAKPVESKPVSKPAAGAGVVVFIDPVTGAIRQPDPSEIGTLVGAQPTPAPKIPDGPPVMIYGPGNTVGLRLGSESHAYAVASRTPDGKLSTDCVTGEKPAAARVAASESGNNKGTPQGKDPSDVHQ